MAVTHAEGGPPETGRFKAMAPAAGAIGIIAAIVGVSVMSNTPAQAPASDPAPIAVPGTPAPAPGSIPGMVTTQNDDQGSGGIATGVEIVVKFKNDAAVKDIIDAFWRDQSSARAKFDAWKSGRPEFANL